MKQETRKQIYQAMDSFLTETVDQNDKQIIRSTEQLNKDRHLFVEKMEKIFDTQKKELLEGLIKEFEYGGKQYYGGSTTRLPIILEVRDFLEKRLHQKPPTKPADIDEKEWMFDVVEEAILNEDFIKKYPNMVGGRIEILHKDKQYDVDEIRFMLPEEIYIPFRDALDLKECDYFQLGQVRSEDLKEKL